MNRSHASLGERYGDTQPPASVHIGDQTTRMMRMESDWVPARRSFSEGGDARQDRTKSEDLLGRREQDQIDL